MGAEELFDFDRNFNTKIIGTDEAGRGPAAGGVYAAAVFFEKVTEDNRNNNDYIKENIEPILVSYIFTMKDFNVDDETKKKVIEEFCHIKEYEKYKFDINELLTYFID